MATCPTIAIFRLLQVKVGVATGEVTVGKVVTGKIPVATKVSIII